jgi:hypothetical protein
MIFVNSYFRIFEFAIVNEAAGLCGIKTVCPAQKPDEFLAGSCH